MKRFLILAAAVLVSFSAATCQVAPRYELLAKDYLEQKASFNSGHIPVSVAGVEVIDSLFFSFGYALKLSQMLSDFNTYVSGKLLEAAMAGGPKEREIASAVVDTIMKVNHRLPEQLRMLSDPESVSPGCGEEFRKALKVRFDFGAPGSGENTAILYFDADGKDLWCDGLSIRSSQDLISKLSADRSKLLEEALEQKFGR